MVWEAQFGDFINGAQIIIDQYLVAAEDKWGQENGLVLLLPHGYEGQGPEHSSARIERFLTLCAEDNIQVVNATTAAQYFHLLRRQVRREVRKPLIVFTPKSPLRMKRDAEPRRRRSRTGSFQEVLDDPCDHRSVGRHAHRVLLRQGRLGRVRRARQASGAGRRSCASSSSTRSRSEQMLEILEQLPERATSCVWLQEEPENMGAWNFVEHRTWRVKERGYDLRHVARVESGSPATGSKTIHDQELADLMDETFQGF